MHRRAYFVRESDEFKMWKNQALFCITDVIIVLLKHSFYHKLAKACKYQKPLTSFSYFWCFWNCCWKTTLTSLPVCLKTVNENIRIEVKIRSMSQLTNAIRIVLIEFLIWGLDKITIEAKFPINPNMPKQLISNPWKMNSNLVSKSQNSGISVLFPMAVWLLESKSNVWDVWELLRYISVEFIPM